MNENQDGHVCVSAAGPCSRAARPRPRVGSDRICCLVVLVASASSAALSASASEVITLGANRDNNLLKSTFSGTDTGAQINDVNLGGVSRFAVGVSGGDDNRSILSFDLSPLAGKYSLIEAINMRLTFDPNNLTQNYSKSFDIEVYKITGANADWVEGAGDNDGVNEPADSIGATWREKNRGVADWAGGNGTTANGGLISAGIDYETTLLASISSGTTLPSNGDTFDFNFNGTNEELTSLIDDLIADGSGFLMLTPTTGLVNNRDRMFFHSRETANADFRPQLIVQFAAVPEPGGMTIWLLLGLASSTGWYFWVARRRRRATRAL